MIGRLTGKLIYKKPPEILIDVHGVGYEVLASMNTFYQLSDLETEITLWIQSIIREDAHTLYGFFDLSEREMFRALIKVNGVGPKSALGILSSISAAEFGLAVMQEDTARLTKLPGIGKKTAERLVIEMRDRLALQAEDWIGTQELDQKKSINSLENIAQQEAMSALLSLGYKSTEATRVLEQIENRHEMTTEDMIRIALRHLLR